MASSSCICHVSIAGVEYEIKDTTARGLIKALETQVNNDFLTKNEFANNNDIVRKNDITPVTLWENGTPNSDMGAIDIVMSKPLTNYSYYDVYYKVAKDSVEVLQMRVPVGYGTRLCSINTFENYLGIQNRKINYKNATTLNLSNGYWCNASSGGSVNVDDGSIIILKIQGIH